MKVVILAGCKGTRFSEYTKTMPKPMIKVNGKPIIFYIIEDLINLNFKNIVINTHHLPNKFHDELKPYSKTVKIIFEKEILDTGGGFLNAIKKDYFYNLKKERFEEFYSLLSPLLSYVRH